jgi:hypothetical protein
MIGAFKPLHLAFAWAENDDVPLILGRIDFFRHFKICFFQRDQSFEISEIETEA